MIYAILKKNGSGIVEGASSLTGTVIDPLMIEIPVFDQSLIGKKYENGQFIDPPFAETLAEAKTKKTTIIRDGAQAHILNKYPAWYQNDVALGIYSETIGEVMRTGIASVIAESNRCEDLVDAAVTIPEVQAVTPVWPVL